MATSSRTSVWLITCSVSLLSLANCSDGDTPEGDGSPGGAGTSSQAGSSHSGAAQGGTASHAGTAGANTAGSSKGGSATGGNGNNGGAGGKSGGAGTNQGGTDVSGMGGVEDPGPQGGMPAGDAGESSGGAGGGDDETGPHQAPILDYELEEGAGTTVGDSAGDFDATLSAAAWTNDGRNGKALSLVGATPPTQYVSVPPGIFAGVTDTTIAAWVKLKSNPAWSRIFDFGGQGAGTDTRFMYLTPNTAEGMRFSLFGGTAQREATVTTGTLLPLDVWKHVAVTVSAAGQQAIYIDGFPAGKSSGIAISPAELEPLSADSWLGKSRFPDPGFDGALDEFKVYDRILSPAEIAVLAAPKADYSRIGFDEGNGDTSADLSQRGANATLSGGMTWTSGKLGAAVQLSGAEQFVTLKDPIAGCTDELSIAMWVKHTAAGNWARIFDFGGTNDNFMFLTPSTPEGKMHLAIHITGEETMLTTNDTIPADNAWHHLAVVITKTVATAFIDGEPVGNVADPVTPSELGATNEHWLGKSRFAGLGDPYFKGAFDEVRISCRAFTADEVRSLAFD